MTRTETTIALARLRYPQFDSDHLQAFFACRNVFVNDELVTDPHMKIKSDSDLEIIVNEKYVSRGGLKLEHALQQFGLDVKDKVMLDAGASTGGFTDCLLQHGALLVHRVDVGYNQLEYSLRKDSRVIVHERQNIMTLDCIEQIPDMAVADLSFRSISGAASHIMGLVREKLIVALIKPQFEVPKWQVGFDGVVKDPELLRQVMLNVRRTLEEDGCGICDLSVSPIKGRKGNVEFLGLLRLGTGLSEDEFTAVVNRLMEN